MFISLDVIHLIMAFRNNTKIGKYYEKKASKWLEANGYTILQRGKALGQGKGSTAYDLIVEKDGEILYIDVKSAKTTFGIRGVALKGLIKKANGRTPALLFIFKGRILGLFKLYQKIRVN